jgi:hypothetical protein
MGIAAVAGVALGRKLVRSGAVRLRRTRVPDGTLGYQQGGYAGPFASPGLGVGDSKPAESGIGDPKDEPD